ncbi:hypothetical protein [Brevibacillus sp. NRS-1366]|uniref:hypothetical protein n=1 Tax=Brevibacillus sp. NRS-1366 TaxID=3233899 RepID=UPI003D1A8EEF
MVNKMVLNQVMEMAIGQMDSKKGYRGYILALDNIRHNEMKTADTVERIMFDALEEAATYIHILQTGLNRITEELKQMSLKDMIQLTYNLAPKYFETAKVNMDHVWDEIDAILNNTEEMVA